MTPIELLIFIYISLTVGGQIAGMDDRFETPYKTFQNSYLKFKLESEGLEGNLHNRKPSHLIFQLRKPKRPLEFFGAYTKVYGLDFKQSWFQTYYNESDNSIPEEIRKNPTEYFIKNCEYQTPLPIGEFTLEVMDRTTRLRSIIGYLQYNTIDFLEPNQTVFVRIKLGKESELISMTHEIIPTPADIKEIKKCNIGVEANDK